MTEPDAGINAERTPRDIVIELPDIGARGATLITDGGDGNMSFRQERVRIGGRQRTSIAIQPMGGFVIAVDL
ncbi:MAG: hypothetical protein WD795_12050 [Woeseia sp.]